MLIVLEAPKSEPVSVDELKQQCRIDFDDENVLLKRYIVAARQYCEGVSNYMIARQKLRLLFEKFTTDFVIRTCPIISIDSIAYYDSDNASQTIDAAEYVARISDAYTMVNHLTYWPTNLSSVIHKPVMIDVTAGKAQPLEQHKQAILMIAAHWYRHREDVSDLKTVEVPHGARALINLTNNQVF